MYELTWGDPKFFFLKGLNFSKKILKKSFHSLAFFFESPTFLSKRTFLMGEKKKKNFNYNFATVIYSVPITSKNAVQ